MTLPQLITVLEARDRADLAGSLRMADAVWGGSVGPLAGKEGYAAAEKWRGQVLKALRGP